MIQITRPIPAKEIKLLLWDLDGTLVDSELDLAHSINAMLRHLKRPELPIEVVASYIGDGAPMLVRRSLGDPQNEGLVKSSLEYFMSYYREHLLDNTKVYPGVLDTLTAITERSQLKMAVLTNKPINPSRGICDGLKLSGFMSQIYGGNSFQTKKPDPHGAVTLLQEYGTAPNEAIMIGDSQNDVLTANNAGMYSVGVSYGLSPESLKIHPPDVMIDRPEELLEVLKLGA
ncbi:MAG TPA: HAD-IA family hydrolase [Candidatus Saccharimonadales bacterium]|nr:HAD-IA family hydrolase [Candidatus Saccharimonadales bacterium]